MKHISVIIAVVIGMCMGISIPHHTRTTTLLQDKKECEENGGRFMVEGGYDFVDFRYYSGLNVSCIKTTEEENKTTTETLFNYKVELDK